MMMMRMTSENDEFLKSTLTTTNFSEETAPASSNDSSSSSAVSSSSLADLILDASQLSAWEAFQMGLLRHTMLVSVIIIIAYTIVFIVGIIGNSFVVAIVWKSPKMKTVTNYFIVNLAFADILVLVFCLPATLINNLITPYVLGVYVCKTVSYLQGVAVSASINTMVAATADRFLSICFPMYWYLSRRHVRWVIAAIWLFSLTVSLPWALYFTLIPFQYSNEQQQQQQQQQSTALTTFQQTQQPLSQPQSQSQSQQQQQQINMPKFNVQVLACSEDYPSEEFGRMYFIFANLLLQYLVPATLTTLFYFGIWYKIKRRLIPGISDSGPCALKMELIMHKSKLKVAKMMTVAVIVFLLSWLPVYLIFARLKLGPKELQLWEDWLINTIMPLAQWLGASNSCINPILYTIFNRRYKQGFAELLRLCFCCQKTNLAENSTTSQLQLNQHQCHHRSNGALGSAGSGGSGAGGGTGGGTGAGVSGGAGSSNGNVNGFYGSAANISSGGEKAGTLVVPLLLPSNGISAGGNKEQQQQLGAGNTQVHPAGSSIQVACPTAASSFNFSSTVSLSPTSMVSKSLTNHLIPQQQQRESSVCVVEGKEQGKLSAEKTVAPATADETGNMMRLRESGGGQWSQLNCCFWLLLESCACRSSQRDKGSCSKRSEKLIISDKSAAEDQGEGGGALGQSGADGSQPSVTKLATTTASVITTTRVQPPPSPLINMVTSTAQYCGELNNSNSNGMNSYPQHRMVSPDLSVITESLKICGSGEKTCFSAADQQHEQTRRAERMLMVLGRISRSKEEGVERLEESRAVGARSATPNSVAVDDACSLRDHTHHGHHHPLTRRRCKTLTVGERHVRRRNTASETALLHDNNNDSTTKVSNQSSGTGRARKDRCSKSRTSPVARNRHEQQQQRQLPGAEQEASAAIKHPHRQHSLVVSSFACCSGSTTTTSTAAAPREQENTNSNNNNKERRRSHRTKSNNNKAHNDKSNSPVQKDSLLTTTTTTTSSFAELLVANSKKQSECCSYYYNHRCRCCYCSCKCELSLQRRTKSMIKPNQSRQQHKPTATLARQGISLTDDALLMSSDSPPSVIVGGHTQRRAHSRTLVHSKCRCGCTCCRKLAEPSSGCLRAMEGAENVNQDENNVDKCGRQVYKIINRDIERVSGAGGGDRRNHGHQHHRKD